MASPNTSFRFDFFEMQPKELIYQGGAHFDKETPFLRLVKNDDKGYPQTRNFGRVLYYKPVEFGRSGKRADFETTVKFVIKKDKENKFADGLVFFIVPEGHDFPSQSVGGQLGIYDSSDRSPHVFAVEFDIFPNSNWDPAYLHIGINVESKSSKSNTEIPDSFIGEDLTLTVNYVAASELISASLTNGAESYAVSFVCNLSDILTPNVQVGLAASTGDSAANHDVAYWEFTSKLG